MQSILLAWLRDTRVSFPFFIWRRAECAQEEGEGVEDKLATHRSHNQKLVHRVTPTLGLAPKMPLGCSWMLLLASSTTHTHIRECNALLWEVCSWRECCQLERAVERPSLNTLGHNGDWPSGRLLTRRGMETLIPNELVCTFLEKNLDLDDTQCNTVYLV